MRKKIYCLLLMTMMCVGICWGADHKFVLVIDAGHGGHDTGAPGAFSKEKNINLSVALAFGKYVENNCPDVKVIYTRKTDVFVTLAGRADIANKAKADLFVSIHTNALPNGRIARGLQSYTLTLSKAGTNLEVAKRENSVIELEGNDRQHLAKYDPNSPENQVMFELMQSQNMERSVEFARFVQKDVCAMAGRLDKGVYQANLAVLRLTSMPACLIELGFITTPDEEEFLNTSAGVDALARGIYNAFAHYKNKYGGKGAPYKNPAEPILSTPKQPVKVAEAPVAESKPKTEERVVVKDEPDVRSKESGVKSQETDARKETPKKVETSKKVEAPKKVETPKKVEAPKKVETPKNVEAKKETPKTTVSNSKPVFKVQIFAINRVLRPGSQQLKGHAEAEYFKDGNVVKYTIGSSANYQEMVNLRKTLLKDFPEAFVIAFKDGEKMDVNKAIEESKKK